MDSKEWEQYGICNHPEAVNNALWLGVLSHIPIPHFYHPKALCVVCGLIRFVVLSGSWYLSSLTAENTWNLILPLTTTSDFSPRQVYLPVINPKILRVVSSHRILTVCLHYILYQMLHMWGRLYDIIRNNKESWLVCTLIGKMFSASSFKLPDLPYDCSHKSRVLVSLKIYDKDFS